MKPGERDGRSGQVGMSAEHVPRIVLVEDDKRCRRALVRDLTRLGYRVFGARDGVEALGLLRAVHADAVVTDLTMPNMDGLQLILSMKAFGPDLPVIAITGGSAAETRLYLAQRRGAEQVLEKPFTIEQLADAVRSAIGSRTDSLV